MLRVGLLPLLHLLQLLPLLLLLPVLCHLSNPHRHAPPSPSSLWPQTGQEGEKTHSKNVARLSSPEQSLCFPPPLRQSWGCIPGKETEDLYSPPLSVGFLHIHTHTRRQGRRTPSSFSVCLHILHFPSVALTGHFLEQPSSSSSSPSLLFLTSPNERRLAGLMCT